MKMGFSEKVAIAYVFIAVVGACGLVGYAAYHFIAILWKDIVSLLL